MGDGGILILLGVGVGVGVKSLNDLLDEEGSGGWQLLDFIFISPLLHKRYGPYRRKHQILIHTSSLSRYGSCPVNCLTMITQHRA